MVMGDGIRLARADDAEGICAIYTPIVRDTIISFEVDPPTTEQMRERIGETLEQFPWLVFRDADRVVGYAYANAFRARPAYRWSAEVSVYVAPQAQRRGIGRRLYRSLFRLLDRQGYRSLYGVIALPNPPSVALHEQLGFRRVALLPAAGYKLGGWWDVAWMQYELRPPAADPAEPIPLPGLSTEEPMSDHPT